jgi:hypothetical protein
MILYGFVLIAMFLSLVVQELIPGFPWLFQGARILILPVVFFYGALAFPYGPMLGLAFCAGFMWDALHVQVVDSNVEISLGWSIILYAALGAIMSGFRPLFERGFGVLIHAILSGIFVSLLVLGEYLMITFRRGDFLFPPVIWWRIGGAGAMALMMAPVVYLTFHLLGRMVGEFKTVERRRAL